MDCNITVLTLDYFMARQGQAFRPTEPTGVVLELVSVTEGKFSTAAHPAFALRFTGPLEPQLEQQTYDLINSDGDTLAIFLVPVARDANGMLYEAIFN
jgi:hypothetical protein